MKMNKKYIAPQVCTKPLEDITPLMAGSGEKNKFPISDEEVDEQGAKRNTNIFSSDTDDDEQDKSIWE